MSLCVLRTLLIFVPVAFYISLLVSPTKHSSDMEGLRDSGGHPSWPTQELFEVLTSKTVKTFKELIQELFRKARRKCLVCQGDELVTRIETFIREENKMGKEDLAEDMLYSFIYQG